MLAPLAFKRLHRSHSRHPRKCLYRSHHRHPLGNACTARLHTRAPLASLVPSEMLVPLAFKHVYLWHSLHPLKCLYRSPPQTRPPLASSGHSETQGPLAFKRVHRSHRRDPRKLLYRSHRRQNLVPLVFKRCTARIAGTLGNACTARLQTLAPLAPRLHRLHRLHRWKWLYRLPSKACTLTQIFCNVRKYLYRSLSAACTASIIGTLGNAFTIRLPTYAPLASPLLGHACTTRLHKRAPLAQAGTLGNGCTARLQTVGAPLDRRHAWKCLYRLPRKECTARIASNLGNACIARLQTREPLASSAPWEKLVPLAMKRVHPSHGRTPWKCLYFLPSNMCVSGIAGRPLEMLVPLAVERVHR